ncbi:Peptidase family M23 family protein [Moraxella macacae 0408225]|uniref:Peptidase family M23 family protein n=1 Tax=Moraxella macacae 0408225 TaxID=1230338 RepID=L2F9B0_9GAMM|nr:M23 family metallopeptidase [Moraxella macacae]ELA09644.1 Peptidase family M23 family protein [Moraxella macacae 0408225]
MKLALTVLPFVALITSIASNAALRDNSEEYYVGDISSDIQLLSQQAQQKEDRLAILANKLSNDNTISITNVYSETPTHAGNGLLPVRPITSKARMTSGFGYRHIFGKTQFHKGMDFAAPVGTPIYATGNGVVTYSGWGSGYGRYIEIDHGNGVTTRYAHNSANLVSVGDTVYANQHIANVGNTGRSTGPHLHYEVRQNGQAVNPQTYLALAPER